jgi:hypothetical protein
MRTETHHVPQALVGFGQMIQPVCNSARHQHPKTLPINSARMETESKRKETRATTAAADSQRWPLQLDKNHTHHIPLKKDREAKEKALMPLILYAAFLFDPHQRVFDHVQLIRATLENSGSSGGTSPAGGFKMVPSGACTVKELRWVIYASPPPNTVLPHHTLHPGLHSSRCTGCADSAGTSACPAIRMSRIRSKATPGRTYPGDTQGQNKKNLQHHSEATVTSM